MPPSRNQSTISFQNQLKSYDYKMNQWEKNNKARTHPATVFWLQTSSCILPPAEIPLPAYLRLHTLRLEQEVVTMTPIVPKHHTISLTMIHHELMMWFNAKTTPLYEPNQQSTLLIS